MTDLPQYKCHKVVGALKIEDIRRYGDDEATEEIAAMIVPENKDYYAFPVGKAYVEKHNPQPGGYYVRYEDGYESWSPASVFEAGYTRIEQE